MKILALAALAATLMAFSANLASAGDCDWPGTRTCRSEQRQETNRFLRLQDDHERRREYERRERQRRAEAPKAPDRRPDMELR